MQYNPSLNASQKNMSTYCNSMFTLSRGGSSEQFKDLKKIAKKGRPITFQGNVPLESLIPMGLLPAKALALIKEANEVGVYSIDCQMYWDGRRAKFQFSHGVQQSGLPIPVIALLDYSIATAIEGFSEEDVAIGDIQTRVNRIARQFPQISELGGVIVDPEIKRVIADNLIGPAYGDSFVIVGPNGTAYAVIGEPGSRKTETVDLLAKSGLCDHLSEGTILIDAFNQSVVGTTYGILTDYLFELILLGSHSEIPLGGIIQLTTREPISDSLEINRLMFKSGFEARPCNLDKIEGYGAQALTQVAETVPVHSFQVPKTGSLEKTVNAIGETIFS